MEVLDGETGPVGEMSPKGAAIPKALLQVPEVGVGQGFTACVAPSTQPWACCSLGLPLICPVPWLPVPEHNRYCHSGVYDSAQRVHTQRQDTRCPSGLRCGDSLLSWESPQLD